ncbi:MAG: hypothetical protein Sapg2KO_51580 [Saprospiraceae bacterium]
MDSGGEAQEMNKISQNLDEWLAKSFEEREALEDLAFAKVAISKAEATAARTALSADRQSFIQSTFGSQWEARNLELEGLSMPFFYQTFGDKPVDGRSLFISMHGGGGAPANVNDQQYENQKHLYDQTMNTLEGVYLAPRAPTNTWNLWHQAHISEFFNLIIQLAVIYEDVNPNKVYLLGYSAGGDGVYQLAPRMADFWAAAAMMAGHPNDASPISLSNTPFTIHMGAEDAAYDRNKKAAEWKDLLADLATDNPNNYVHDVQIHEDKGHWMDLKDAVALPWMQNYQRNPIPERVVWKQTSTPVDLFYWLRVPFAQLENGGEIVAEYNRQNNEINILSNYSSRLDLQLNDDMLDLDQAVLVKYQGQPIYEGMVERTILNIYNSLIHKGDYDLSFPAVLSVLNNSLVE